MINKNEQTFLKKKLPLYIKMASSVSLVVGAMGVAGHAYAADVKATDGLEEIVVTGQRKTAESAQTIKKNANQIVDSIVSDDIGKLPDRSITEAIQRLPGVTIDHFMSQGDPEHFSAEGSGVAVRGLTQVRSELNGRDSFSAAGGRSLSFEDVPAELMAGVDVYKNPSADMIEGGFGGTVNLRTRMPFDSSDQIIGLSVGANYGNFIKETNPSYSGLYSNTWETEAGKFGFLVDLASSEVSTRTDGIYTRAFFPRADVVSGKTVYVTGGADWRQLDFNRKRDGGYLAFQWAPNDDVEVYLTAFKSKYEMNWTENAIFLNDAGQLNRNDDGTVGMSVMPGADSTYSSTGVFQSGTITKSGGISMGADVYISGSESNTTDISTGVKWTPDDNWEFAADIQHTKSTSNKFDSTVTTEVKLSSVYLDLRGEHPSINVTNPAELTDRTRYQFCCTQEHLEDNFADENAFRIDAKYKLEDSIIKSVKAGFRLTDKSAENMYAPYHWTTANLYGNVQNPLTAELGEQVTFDNFFRGGAHLPGSIWAPIRSLAERYPTSYYEIHQTGENAYPDWAKSWAPIWAETDLSAKTNLSEQDEKTSAIYAQVDFAFDDLSTPIDGNVGVRIVNTDYVAKGVLALVSELPQFNLPAQDVEAQNSYTNVLPTLNLRFKLTEELFVRFAAGKAIARPSFNEMGASNLYHADVDKQALVPGQAPSLSNINFWSSSQGGNPYLKPMESDQFDISTEWYFNEHGGKLHANLFTKDVHDVVQDTMDLTLVGGVQFAGTHKANSGEAKIKGFELGATKFFDSLPAPFDGLGVEANYTYIDSTVKSAGDAKPLDTDGSTYGDLPYAGLSKNSYNLIGMFEKGDWSVRLAYNWRGEFYMGSGANGYNGNFNVADASTSTGYNKRRWRLPVYNDAYGQLDGSVNYKITDYLTVSFEVNNITNSETKIIMKQNNAGNHYGAYYVNDTRYALSLRAKF